MRASSAADLGAHNPGSGVLHAQKAKWERPRPESGTAPLDGAATPGHDWNRSRHRLQTHRRRRSGAEGETGPARCRPRAARVRRGSRSATSRRVPACRSPPSPRSSTSATASPPDTGVRVRGGDRGARLRVEPDRPQPAQPAHERDRHPRRRTSSRSAPSCSRARRGRCTSRGTSSSSTPARPCPTTRSAGSAATCHDSAARSPTASILVTPSVVEVHVQRSRGRGRPPRRLARRCRPSTRENFEGAVDATESPDRARPPPHRLPRRAPRPRVGPPARARATATRSKPPGSPFDPELVRVGALPRRPPRRRRGAARGVDDRPTAIFAANDVSAIQAMESGRGRWARGAATICR